MFRFVTSDPSLEQAHARTEVAMYELAAAIADAFAEYESLAIRLGAYGRDLQFVRAHLSAAGYYSETRERPPSGPRPETTQRRTRAERAPANRSPAPGMTPRGATLASS
jgi:hypothetical protein